jgi:hypothetical protein
MAAGMLRAPQPPNFNSAHPLAFGCDGPTARLFLHFASRPVAPDTSITSQPAQAWAIESAIIVGMRWPPTNYRKSRRDLEVPPSLASEKQIWKASKGARSRRFVSHWLSSELTFLCRSSPSSARLRGRVQFYFESGLVITTSELRSDLGPVSGNRVGTSSARNYKSDEL